LKPASSLVRSSKHFSASDPVTDVHQGCAYLLSCWYPRYDLQKRNAVFYLIGSMASAFSGILAYGFYNMQGLGDLGPKYGRVYLNEAGTKVIGIGSGLSGWRWIFIMQVSFRHITSS
jgi:hypothetical protein